MYLLILTLPLLGSLITGFLGRFLGRYGAGIFSTTCVAGSMLLSLLAFYEVGFLNTPCYLILTSWITSGIFSISWGFLFDSLTCVMLLVVTIVSTLVHLYSIKYMENDPHSPRFMAFLQIFTFFMLMLVTADNLVQMFLGWEGVGISSYLLINFWHTRYWANQSALKALLVNRIGDFSLSIGIFLIFYVFRSVEYSLIFPMIPLFMDSYIYFLGFKLHSLTTISFFLFLGAVGKSAQLGLHTWLPDAMEGPTPVSALIHAATMVTAGVFLLVRFSPLFEFTPFILFLMVVFGSLTAFFASMIGVFQNDLKKIIAYSTCSQLGYMVFCCGLSNYAVTMFHLSNHAFFKALLFLCAGSVIHAISDEQDIRKMGSLINFLPLTYSVMLIGTLALTGFPFLTGFYSKDFILELSQVFRYSNIELTYKSFACWLGNLSVFFTAFYSFRLIYLTFINNSNSHRILLNKVHESSFLMYFPLITLAIGSLFIGFLTKDFFIGPGTSFWNNSIFTLPVNSIYFEAEFLPTGIKWLPFGLSFLGIILATSINITNFNLYNSSKWNPILHYTTFLVSKKWFIDILYNRTLVKLILNFGYRTSFKTFDRGFIELLGPYGISKLVLDYSRKLVYLQTGQITHYLFFMVLGICFFVIGLPYITFDSFSLLLDYRLIGLFFLLIPLN
uniref:NADH-ubiquinone oxidoreductase chain 5 n=1 Tax=Corallina officinalis TaxID=35170 RepID=A0A343AYV9_COROI|nr:NADH dehydrogenase subunit 5 [Corallina officinalis]APX55297.1 NADH dehydrogenase subunit 5 [Corallina officinalis]QJF58201.1 NADH dehydrogenase subunit 5 [Corallina officinalis]